MRYVFQSLVSSKSDPAELPISATFRNRVQPLKGLLRWSTGCSAHRGLRASWAVDTYHQVYGCNMRDCNTATPPRYPVFASRQSNGLCFDQYISTWCSMLLRGQSSLWHRHFFFYHKIPYTILLDWWTNYVAKEVAMMLHSVESESLARVSTVWYCEYGIVVLWRLRVL